MGTFQWPTLAATEAQRASLPIAPDEIRGSSPHEVGPRRGRISPLSIRPLRGRGHRANDTPDCIRGYSDWRPPGTRVQGAASRVVTAVIGLSALGFLAAFGFRISGSMPMQSRSDDSTVAVDFSPRIESAHQSVASATHIISAFICVHLRLTKTASVPVAAAPRCGSFGAITLPPVRRIFEQEETESSLRSLAFCPRLKFSFSVSSVISC